MGGRIRQLHVEVGQTVSRGTLLATMDNSQLEQARVQLADAQLHFSRVDELYKIGGIAKAQWDAAQSTLVKAQTAFKTMEENTYLRSPIAGVVTARNYDAGDVSSPQLPIFSVQQINPVKFSINLSEHYYPRIKKGMMVTITVDALPEQAFQGTITLIDPTIDPMTHSFSIEVSVNNNNNRLRPGMYARCNLDFGTQKILLISDRALVKQMGSAQRFVYVAEGGIARQRTVEVGRRMNGTYEIISGILEGETVITEGSQLLKDGQAIEIKKEQKAVAE